MTETCVCPIHGTAPVSGADCFVCKEEERALIAGCTISRSPLPPNPKQAYGDKKVPVHLVPSALILAAAKAFLEGARKYGPYNWRENAVEAETYIGAALRHLMSWHDGEDIDPECNVPHLGLAAACIAILLDAAHVGNLIDNRPPKAPTGEQIRKSTGEAK